MSFPTCSVAAVMAALSGSMSAAMISFMDAAILEVHSFTLCQAEPNFTTFSVRQNFYFHASGAKIPELFVCFSLVLPSISGSFFLLGFRFNGNV